MIRIQEINLLDVFVENKFGLVASAGVRQLFHVTGKRID